MKVSGVAEDGGDLFVMQGVTNIKWQDLAIHWMMLAQAALNGALVLGSIIALVMISCKQCEGFSTWMLIVILLTSSLMMTLQICWFT